MTEINLNPGSVEENDLRKLASQVVDQRQAAHAATAKIRPDDDDDIAPPMTDLQQRADRAVQDRAMAGFVGTDTQDPDLANKFRRRFRDTIQTDRENERRAFEVSIQSGLPLETVRRNLDDIEADVHAGQLDADGILKRSPESVKWFMQPGNAEAVGGDITKLAGLEWAINAPVAAFMTVGVGQVEFGVRSFADYMEEQFNTEILDDVKNEQRLQYLETHVLPQTFGEESFFERGLIGAAKLLPQIIGAAAFSGAGALVGAGSGALVSGGSGARLGQRIGTLAGGGLWTFIQESGPIHRELATMTDEDGVPIDIDRQTRLTLTGIGGSAAAALELLGMGAVMRLIPGAGKTANQIGREAVIEAAKRGGFLKAVRAFDKQVKGHLGKRIAFNYGTGVGGEVVTETLQEITAIATEVMARKIHYGNFDHENWEAETRRVMDTALQTFEATVVLGFGSPGSSTFEHYQHRRAVRSKARLDSMALLSGIAREQIENPTKFREFIQQVTKKKGAPKNVYVPVEEFNDAYENPAEAAEHLGLQKEYSDASSIQGDVAIPLATYLEKVAETEQHKKFAGHMRLYQGEASLAESIASLDHRFDRLIENVTDVEGMDLEQREIYLDAYETIKRGVKDDAVADQGARIWTAFFTTLAQDTGQSPIDLYTQYTINVRPPEEAPPEYGGTGVPRPVDPGDNATPLQRELTLERNRIEQERERRRVEQSGWHGSPHNFDRFSLDNIGTGEGAQAFGWGLYFAGNKAVADYYRKTLVENQLRVVGPDGGGEGATLKVELPEDSELLDWDKPLSEQPAIAKKIRSAIKDGALDFVSENEAIRDSRMSQMRDALQEMEMGATTGETIHRILGSGQGASEFLRDSAGIPGHRYLDGSSRGKGEGSYNYVIYDDTQIKVVERLYQDRAIRRLYQTASVMRANESMRKYGLTPGKTYSIREVAAALEARQAAKYGTIDRDDRSDASAQRIASWMAAEIKFELENPEASALGWYGEKFQQALDIFADTYPELKKQGPRDTLTALIALTSDGQDVMKNYRLAIDLYENYRTTGKFVSDRGHNRIASIKGNLIQLEQVIERLGDDNVGKWMLQIKTVRELTAIAKEDGHEFSSDWPVDAKLPMASLVLGPKLGTFYANLMGLPQYVTMDRWWSRSFNRYRGKIQMSMSSSLFASFKGKLHDQEIQQDVAKAIRSDPAKKVIRSKEFREFKERLGDPKMSSLEAMQKLIEVRTTWVNAKKANKKTIGKDANEIYEKAFPYEISDEEGIAAVVKYREVYSNSKWKDKTPVNVTANNLHKQLFTELEDAPYNGGDRMFMAKAARFAQKKIKKSTGRDISVADIQAVLWYYEKRLYGELGARPTAKISFHEAARGRSDAAGPKAKVAKRLLQSSPILQTLTREFKKWFRDSKVVDENGKPLVVYHGTNQPITMFDGGRLGASTVANSALGGFFFSDDPKVADVFSAMAAKNVRSNVEAFEAESSRLQAKSERLTAKAQRTRKASDWDAAEAAQSEWEDLEIQSMREGEVGAQTIPVYLSFQNPLVIDAKGGMTPDLPTSGSITAAIERAKAEGRDGVIINNFVDAGGYSTPATHYIAFDAAQIKSATANSGAFDLANPSILFQSQSVDPKAAVKRFQDRWEPVLEDVHLYYSEKTETISLTSVRVKKDERKQGMGSEFMLQLAELADELGVTVKLTPAQKDEIHGTTSKKRLVKFYKRFGFVENKGRNKDFTKNADEMYRDPAKTGLPKLTQGDGKPKGERGWLDILGDKKFDMQILKTSDASTVFHESAHFFLEVLGDINESDKATAKTINDYQVLLGWFGVQSRSEITVKHHEMMAEGFERYAYEGKAPTEELQGIFNQLKAWLTQLYGEARNLIEINDNVRGVFDRMLVSEQEMQKQDAKDFMDTMDIMKEGMTGGAYDEYLERSLEMQQAGADRLRAQLMEDAEVTMETAYVEERDRLEEEIKEQVSKLASFRALLYLETGEIHGFDENEMPALFRAKDGKKWKLDARSIDELYDTKEERRQVRDDLRVNNGRRDLYRNDDKANDFDAMDVEEAAARFGFGSGKELVEALRKMPNYEDAIGNIVQKRLDDKFGNKLRDLAQRSESVEDAQMMEAGIDKALAELRGLHQVAKRRKVDLKEEGRTGILDRERMKLHAANLIGDMEIVDINPSHFYNQARKYTRMAYELAKKGELVAAIRAKRLQANNMILYREARDTKLEMEQLLRYLQRLGRDAARKKIGKAGFDYLEQIDEVLESYELRKPKPVIDPARLGAGNQVGGKKVYNRDRLRAWIAKQIENGELVGVDPDLIQDVEQRHFRNVPAKELRLVRDLIMNIDSMARTKTKLLTNKKRREKEVVKREAIGAAEQNMPRLRNHHIDPEQRDAGPIGGLKKLARGFNASLLRMEEVFRRLDAGDPNGIWHQVIWNPIAEAQFKENELNAVFTVKVAEALNAMPQKRREQLYGKPVYIESLGVSLTWQAIFALALNTGTHSGLQRVMDGKRRGAINWTPKAAEEVLSKMEREDWEFVQTIWDTLHDLLPLIEAHEKRMTGVPFESIPHRAFTRKLADGTEIHLKGGYYPLVYDQEDGSTAGRLQAEAGKNAATIFEARFASAITPHGYTQKRVDTFKDPILLSLDVLPRHLSQVIHDLTHREAVMNAYNFINEQDINFVLRERLGNEMYLEMVEWVKSVANDKAMNGGSHIIEKFMAAVRSRFSLAIMGYKTTISMQNVVNFANVAERTGPVALSRALAKFANNPKEAVELVNKASPEMAFRFSNLERDFRDVLNRLRGKNSMIAQSQKFAFSLVQYSDMMSAYPAWMAAFDAAMNGEVKDLHGKVIAKNEAEAVMFANEVVRTTLGSGASKDLAAIQRGNEFQKWATMFYSFFSVQYMRYGSLYYDAKFRKDQGEVIAALPYLLARLVAFAIIAPTLAEFIVGRGPEDDESFAKWFAYKVLMYPLLTVPFLRDAANFFEGKARGTSSRGIQYGSMAGSAEQVVSFIAEVGDAGGSVLRGEEVDKRALAKATNRAAGMVFGLPSSQMEITGGQLFDLMTGEEKPDNAADALWHTLFRRPPRNKRKSSKGKTYDYLDRN